MRRLGRSRNSVPDRGNDLRWRPGDDIARCRGAAGIGWQQSGGIPSGVQPGEHERRIGYAGEHEAALCSRRLTTNIAEVEQCCQDAAFLDRDVLHVADAFEAMTAARPYRMTPRTAEQALAELRKFAGIQFDPVVVDALVKTHHVEGVADPGRTVQPRPIPLIGQAAATRLQEPPATGTLPANAALPAASQAPEQA